MNLKDQYKQILTEATSKKLDRILGSKKQRTNYTKISSTWKRRQNREKKIARKVLQGEYGDEIRRQFKDFLSDYSKGTSKGSHLASKYIQYSKDPKFDTGRINAAIQNYLNSDNLGLRTAASAFRDQLLGRNTTERSRALSFLRRIHRTQFPTLKGGIPSFNPAKTKLPPFQRPENRPGYRAGAD